MPGMRNFDHRRSRRMRGHAAIGLGRGDEVSPAEDDLQGNCVRNPLKVRDDVGAGKHARRLPVAMRINARHGLNDGANLLLRRMRSEQSGTARLRHATGAQRLKVADADLEQTLAFRRLQPGMARSDARKRNVHDTLGKASGEARRHEAAERMAHKIGARDAKRIKPLRQLLHVIASIWKLLFQRARPPISRRIPGEDAMAGES